MKRAKDLVDDAVRVPQLEAQQRLQIWKEHDVRILNTPYGSTRAAYGWGDLFRPPPTTIIKVPTHHGSCDAQGAGNSSSEATYHHIHIGLSSFNAVPTAKSNRTMKSLLHAYRRKFQTVEHCYPYHKVGEADTWQGWADMVRTRFPNITGGGTSPNDSGQAATGSQYVVHPGRFHFTIKSNNFLTHVKQLGMDAEVEAHVRIFFEECLSALDPFAGPVLLQLPPSFQCSATNRERLRTLQAALPKDHIELVACACPPSVEDDAATPRSLCRCPRGSRPRVRIAVEFRHRSWYHEDTFALLRQLGWTLVVAHFFDDTTFATPVETGTGLLYVRLHGSMGAYVGDYGPERMRRWAELVVDFVTANGLAALEEDRKAAVPLREVFFFLNNNDSHVNELTSSVVDATYLAQEIMKILAARIAAGPAASHATEVTVTPAETEVTVIIDEG